MKAKYLMGLIAVAVLLITAPLLIAAEKKVPPTAPKEYLDMKNPFKADKAVLDAAKEIYDAKCKKCHGEKGDGKGSASKDLETKPQDFTDKANMSGRAAGQLFWITEKGSKDTDMDAFGSGTKANLSKDDIWKLVTYVQQFAK